MFTESLKTESVLLVPFYLVLWVAFCIEYFLTGRYQIFI